jgi:hypothetical protein
VCADVQYLCLSVYCFIGQGALSGTLHLGSSITWAARTRSKDNAAAPAILSVKAMTFPLGPAGGIHHLSVHSLHFV